jgi:hypothetical protein
MASAASPPSRPYYKVQVNKVQTFQVDVRYQNLQVIGSGSYGLVCSATDTVRPRCVVSLHAAALYALHEPPPPTTSPSTRFTRSLAPSRR